MDTKQLIDTAVSFGPGMFFALIMVGFMFFVIKWVFKMFETHVKTLSVNVEGLANVIRTLHEDNRERFGSLVKAQDFQREEHEKIARAQDDTANQIIKLIKAVKDFECRAIRSAHEQT